MYLRPPQSATKSRNLFELRLISGGVLKYISPVYQKPYCNQIYIIYRLNSRGMGAWKMVKKYSKIWFFRKLSNLSHMVWVVSGPASGCCLTSINVCSTHTKPLRKFKKQLEHCCFLAHPQSEDSHKPKGAIFELFCRFSQTERLRVWHANLHTSETTSPSRYWNNPFRM